MSTPPTLFFLSDAYRDAARKTLAHFLTEAGVTGRVDVHEVITGKMVMFEARLDDGRVCSVGYSTPDSASWMGDKP